MKRLLLCLPLVSGLAAAENDLLKVGKTPAEKLDEKVVKAKDNAARALEKLHDKNRVLTETLHTLTGPEPPAAAALPDPTAPDETFRQNFRTLLRGNSRDGQGELPPLPDVKLGAWVLRKDREPAVLLKIDGRTVLARTNEDITLIRDGQAVHLRIQNIDEDGIRVLIQPHNELLTLH